MRKKAPPNTLQRIEEKNRIFHNFKIYHCLITRLAGRGTQIRQATRYARHGDGFFVEHERPMYDREYNGAYLHQLQLSRKQLVRNEVVAHVSVVVLEQIDTYE